MWSVPIFVLCRDSLIKNFICKKKFFFQYFLKFVTAFCHLSPVIHQRSGGVRPAAPRAGLVQQQRQVTARTPVLTPRMPVPQPRPMPAPTPVKTFTPYPVTPNLPPRYPVGQPSSAGQPQASSVSRQPPQQQQQQMGSTPVIPRGYGRSSNFCDKPTRQKPWNLGLHFISDKQYRYISRPQMQQNKPKKNLVKQFQIQKWSINP